MGQWFHAASSHAAGQVGPGYYFANIWSSGEVFTSIDVVHYWYERSELTFLQHSDVAFVASPPSWVEQGGGTPSGWRALASTVFERPAAGSLAYGYHADTIEVTAGTPSGRTVSFQQTLFYVSDSGGVREISQSEYSGAVTRTVLGRSIDGRIELQVQAQIGIPTFELTPGIAHRIDEVEERDGQ